MNKDVNIPLLLDLYGKVLSKVQYEDLDSYYNQDLSLSEIADNVGKSRQGVFESIKRAEVILADMESKLGFLSKMNEIRNDFNQIDEMVKQIENQPSGKSLTKQLKHILRITAKHKSE